MHTAEVMNIGLCEPKISSEFVLELEMAGGSHGVILQLRLPQWRGIASLNIVSPPLCVRVVHGKARTMMTSFACVKY